MNKRIISTLLVAALSISTLTACKIGNTEYVWDTSGKNNDYVFTINEAGCGETEMRLYMCNYKNLFGKEYGIDLWNYDFKEASLEEYVRDVAVDELVRITSINLIAQEQQMTLTDDEMELVYKAAKEYYESLTDDEIEYISINEEGVAAAYERYALAMKLYKSLTDDVNTEVSDDDARVLQLQQIYVKDGVTASTVATKLAQGEDFALVGATYNEAEEFEITVARGDMEQQIENVVFELDNDQLSNKVQTSDGYYFFKCLSKNVEELTEKNKEVIRVARKEQQFNQQYSKFYKTAQYNLNKEIFNSLVIDKGVEITTDSFFEVYDKYFD